MCDAVKFLFTRLRGANVQAAALACSCSPSIHSTAMREWIAVVS
jgi:hypothetical protein